MTRRALAAVTAVVAALLTGPAALADTAWKRLISPAEYAALEDGAVLIDIRPPTAYLTAHIPGAVNAPYGAWRGPAENPGQPLTDAALTELLQGLGLTAESRVVVTHAGVSQTDFGAAARVYWTLKSAGLGEIAILNGGVRGWVAAGLALAVEPTRPEPSTARFALSDTWAADRSSVAAAAAGESDTRLVDARPADFFAGREKHTAAAKAGTIAGAQSLVHETWFAGDSHELAPSERIAALAAEAGIAEGDGDVVSFCNTGHWAATSWFAMSEIAGIEGVKLYPESAVGWIAGGGAVAPGEGTARE